jgi:hypothetical protein
VASAEDPNLGSRFCSGIAVPNQKSSKPARFTFNVHLSKPKDPGVAANTRPKVDGITVGACAVLIACVAVVCMASGLPTARRHEQLLGA